MVVNDLTIRERVNRKDMQEMGMDWVGSKCAPTSLPTGPYLVPAQFVGDPQQLRISLRHNGCRHEPSSYLRRIFFDSIVYRPEQLRHLIAEVGASQVVVGTDYPYDMAHYDMHALLAAVPDLSDAERAAILGGNAARLLNLPAP